MKPNTLIFVDFPSDDVEACAAFYRDVFGWEVEGRPTGVFHRGVPGGFFPLEDGSDSPIGNLHVGFADVENLRPHPDPAGVEPRHLARDGRGVRVWILVSDDDSEDAILDRADQAGRQGAVAPPLLGRVQRPQWRVRRSVGHHGRAVDQGRQRPRHPGRTHQ